MIYNMICNMKVKFGNIKVLNKERSVLM